MIEIPNEILFYGGLAAAGLAAVILAVFLIVFFVGGIKLNVKLDMEYGNKSKKDKLNSKRKEES